MTENSKTAAVTAAGTSLWLDDLSRRELQNGGLADLIATRNIVGVTTNPSIFNNAIAEAPEYAEDIAVMAKDGATADEVVTALTVADVQQACDVMRPVYDATDGVDGRVSLEVDPRLAHDTAGTVQQARELWAAIDRPNAMIKIPATDEGIAAIAEVIGSGISVNVTLIFSPSRHQQVVDAYLDGLERAAENGVDLSTIGSVASVFVSRVDTALAGSGVEGLPQGVAVANALACNDVADQAHASDRFVALKEKGAKPQRALWASTGVKDPAMRDTVYVDDLAIAGTVSTVPRATLDAIADHSEPTTKPLAQATAEAKVTLQEVADRGVDLEAISAKLEADGASSFVDAWESLLATTTKRMAN